MKLLRAPLVGALLSFAFAGTAWAGPDLTAEMYSRSDRLGGSAYFSVGTVLLEFAIKNIGDAPAPAHHGIQQPPQHRAQCAQP